MSDSVGGRGGCTRDKEQTGGTELQAVVSCDTIRRCYVLRDQSVFRFDLQPPSYSKQRQKSMSCRHLHLIPARLKF